MLQNGKLIIDASKANQVKLSKLSGDGLVDYVLSTIGIRKHVSHSKVSNKIYSSKIDRLVHERDSGHFLRMMSKNYVVGPKTPKTDLVEYFGVEIECNIPVSKLDLDDYCGNSSSMCECYDCGGSGTLEYLHRATGQTIDGECQSCEGTGETEYESDDSEENKFEAAKKALSKLIEKRKIRGVDIHEDGSIRQDDSGEVGIEFAILVPQNDYSNLEKLCDLLKELDATVNKSCGLHVHIDARKVGKEGAAYMGSILGSYLPFLTNMVPKSRRENTYCLPRVSEDKYSAVNIGAYSARKTVEVRLHSGTTSFEKISNWLDILKVLKSAPKNDRVSLKSFAKMFPDNLRKYVLERTEKFSGLSEDSESYVYEDQLEMGA